MVFFFPFKLFNIPSSSNMNLFIFKWFKFSFGGVVYWSDKSIFQHISLDTRKSFASFCIGYFTKACAQEIIFYENKYLSYSHLLKNVLLNDNLALDYGVNE